MIENARRQYPRTMPAGSPVTRPAAIQTGRIPPAAPGTYALILRCRKAVNIRVGRLGTVALRPGHYIYVGSALGPGGLRARIARHRRRDKKRHWHIDYLRRHTAFIDAWHLADGQNHEHEWAAALAERYEIAHPRFGASDCRCAGHLLYAGTHAPSEEGARSLLSRNLALSVRPT